MLTLMTPTVRRPQCFRLLEGYIKDALDVYGRPVQWLVVTDGELDGYSFNLGQTVIVRDRRADPPGRHSICGNYLAALEHVEGDKLLCVEDDDYYSPAYLATMDRELDAADLVGSCPALYYNLMSRHWRIMPNKTYASLAQTGFTREVVGTFKQGCNLGNPFVDMFLWTHWAGTMAKPFKLIDNPPNNLALHVGIKGAWGEPGIGLGHDPAAGQPDPYGAVLRQWIGLAAASNYLDYPD